MNASPIVVEPEISEITPFSKTTRWREEKRGRFPRRFQISTRKIGYHRTEVEEWLRDPSGWPARRTGGLK
jgi:prophage regulatory protein